jgi:hypothetical protein
MKEFCKQEERNNWNQTQTHESTITKTDLKHKQEIWNLKRYWEWEQTRTSHPWKTKKKKRFYGESLENEMEIEWNKENVEKLKCNEKLTCWLHAHWSSSISCQAQELLCNTSHVNFSTQAHFGSLRNGLHNLRNGK